MSRLSDLAGCRATAEEFFPIGVARSLPGTSAESGARFGEMVRRETVRPDHDSSPGLQLACLLQEVQGATNRANKLVFERSERELTTRVRPDSWSAAECLEHLTLTTQAFVPSIAGILAETPALTTSRPLRVDMLAKLLIRMLEPPYRLRHKVLPHLAPQHGDFPSVRNAFLQSQEDLARIIRSAVGLAIDTVRIQSPVCSRMSYNVYGALGILSAHQRRHLWQVEQILRALDRRAA